MANTAQENVQHDQSAIALRCLAARLSWATLGQFADPETRYMALGGARLSANLQGREDFLRGRDEKDVPPLLADVPDLAEAWRNGWTGCQALQAVNSKTRPLVG